MSFGQSSHTRGAHELITLERPELRAQLTEVFVPLAQAGVEYPVAYGMGLSELDRGLAPKNLDVVALLPAHGTRKVMTQLIEQGLTPRFQSGVACAAQLLLAYPDFEVTLRLREGIVRDAPTADNPNHKVLIPVGAAEMVLMPNTAAHQIAAEAGGPILATRAYVASRNTPALPSQAQPLRTFA